MNSEHYVFWRTAVNSLYNAEIRGPGKNNERTVGVNCRYVNSGKELTLSFYIVSYDRNAINSV